MVTRYACPQCVQSIVDKIMLSLVVVLASAPVGLESLMSALASRTIPFCRYFGLPLHAASFVER